MRNEIIFPSNEIKSQSPIDNKRNRKNFNKSNISKTLKNPNNIFHFLFKIEENIILSNLNKSTAVSFNNINLINNSRLNKNLIRNQMKYIQMTDDFIDNKIESSMDYPYNESEYQYMKIINNMQGVQKNASYNQKIPHQVDNYNFVYNKAITNSNRTNNNNLRQNSPRNLQNQEKLDLSSFSTTIGGNIPHSYSNSNKININSNNNNNYGMINVENESRGPKQLKTFKIGKKEDFIISPNNNTDINSTENKNKEKIILDNIKRAESPTSIRTFNTGSSISFSTGTNSLPSNNVAVEYNNKIKKNSNIKKSPPKNINKSPTFSKIMVENSKTPQNNSRKRKDKLVINKDENKNKINNNNNNIIKNTRTNMAINNPNNKLNIFTNITPRNKVVKKIKINMDEAHIKERAKSPIQINYHHKDNKSFISPIKNKEFSNLSEDERDQSFKHNKINYSNIDMSKSRNKNEYINANNINSYITQMLKKKKKIIKLNPYNNNNNSDINININNNRCITNENKKDISREHPNQIRKSPTSIKSKSKIIIKKEITEKNLSKNKNNSNKIKAKIVQKKIKDKEKVINNSYINNVNNTNINNVNNANKTFIKENNYSNKIINNQIVNKNSKNEDAKNKKQILNISNLKYDYNINIDKESNIKNINISVVDNIDNKDDQIITEKKENKENNNEKSKNINIKNNTKKKKKPKKKVFNIDLTEENNDNKNNIKDDNSHSEDISDISLSEDNKPQIYDFDQIYEKREMEPINFNNRQNLTKNFFCSFGQNNCKEENNKENVDNKNEIKKEYNDPVTTELKLLNELKEKIKQRNEKKMDNFTNDNINNNKEGAYKSTELERIIKTYTNNNNDINKKSLIKPYSNSNYNFNIKEENSCSESEEKNNNKINDYKQEIKDKNVLSNNFKSLDKQFYKTNETGTFGEISEEKIKKYNNNNFDSQSFGNKESNINQSSENKISNYTKDEYDNNNNKGKEDQLKFSFKINSDLCESDFNDINFLE